MAPIDLLAWVVVCGVAALIVVLLMTDRRIRRLEREIAADEAARTPAGRGPAE